MAVVLAESENYQQNPEIQISNAAHHFLRSHLLEYDTRLFVFKSPKKLWHRVCLMSNNTYPIFSEGGLRKLLLEEVCILPIDIKIGFKYLQKVNDIFSFHVEKDAFTHVVDHDFRRVSHVIRWFQQIFGGSSSFGTLINKLIKPDHPSRIHLTDIVVACALTIEITPAREDFPSNAYFRFQSRSLSIAIPQFNDSDDDEGIVHEGTRQRPQSGPNPNQQGQQNGPNPYPGGMVLMFDLI